MFGDSFRVFTGEYRPKTRNRLTVKTKNVTAEPTRKTSAGLYLQVFCNFFENLAFLVSFADEKPKIF
jgi:hypothetical protein